MRRAIGILLLTGLVLVLGWPLSALAGADESTGAAASAAALRADFNGDGAADLAIAAPLEDTSRGVVHVLYGSASGLVAAGSQLWSQDSPGIAGAGEQGDEFGSALAAGDFNGDGRADLAVGAQGENGFRGVVHVLYGSAAGLVAVGSQLWSQDSPGVAGVAEGGDRFGFVLAAGDFTGDGAADLAIGAPGENDFAGVAHALYGSAAGLVAVGSQLWSQDSPGIAGVAELADEFGLPWPPGLQRGWLRRPGRGRCGGERRPRGGPCAVWVGVRAGCRRESAVVPRQLGDRRGSRAERRLRVRPGRRGLRWGWLRRSGHRGVEENGFRGVVHVLYGSRAG